MVLDPRDAALQQSCACMSMPMYGSLPAYEEGQRMVVGRNGLFLQMRTPWLDCTVRVGEVSPRLALPYGSVAEHVGFRFGTIPRRLLDEFIAAARQALPDETAGALIHDAATHRLTLRLHDAESADTEHVRYRIADIAEGETLAVDLHSHGHAPAFWSPDDDADDNGVRVCGVFGYLDRAQPTAKFRLVLNGHFVTLPSPWEPAPGPAGGS